MLNSLLLCSACWGDTHSMPQETSPALTSASVTARIMLSKEAIEFFWHELCCANPQNLFSHHCQVGQILIRARSNPCRAQDCLPPSQCPVFSLLTQCDLPRLPEGDAAPLFPRHPASRRGLCWNGRLCFLSQFASFHPSIPHFYFPV